MPIIHTKTQTKLREKDRQKRRRRRKKTKTAFSLSCSQIRYATYCICESGKTPHFYEKLIRAQKLKRLIRQVQSENQIQTQPWMKYRLNKWQRRKKNEVNWTKIKPNTLWATDQVQFRKYCHFSNLICNGTYLPSYSILCGGSLQMACNAAFPNTIFMLLLLRGISLVWGARSFSHSLSPL